MRTCILALFKVGTIKIHSLAITKEYRPELNGLRALAVILVLFYHLDFEWMKGGFLGVDIFLVISGYFISKNILIGLQNSSFTFTITGRTGMQTDSIRWR